MAFKYKVNEKVTHKRSGRVGVIIKTRPEGYGYTDPYFIKFEGDRYESWYETRQLSPYVDTKPNYEIF